MCGCSIIGLACKLGGELLDQGSNDCVIKILEEPAVRLENLTSKDCTVVSGCTDSLIGSVDLRKLIDGNLADFGFHSV